jgi:O-antigen/teichoic acid export membrane protein
MTTLARQMLTVMSGSVAAQALPLLFSPILTRLFLPADFGALAAYGSVVAIAIVLATGRYELAVLLPKQAREAFDLSVLGVLLSATVATVTMMILLLWWQFDPALGGLTVRWGGWIIALPFSIFLAATFQILTYWNTRSAQFKQIAAARVGQSTVMCSTQLAAGLSKVASGGGLIAGQLAGQAAACAMLWRHNRTDWHQRWAGSNTRRLVAVARKHRRFPMFMIPGQFANAASTQVPVLLLGVFFNAGSAGFYSLAERVLILPSYIIGSAIGDVYRQRAAEHFNGHGNCRELFLKALSLLAILGLIPALVIALAGPWLFSLVFGSVWRESGELAVLLAPMLYCQILGSPLSQTVYLARMQHLDMLWQFLRLGLAVAAVMAGRWWGVDHRLAVGLFSAAFCFTYLLHVWMQYHASCGEAPRRAAAGEARQ